MLPQKTRSLPYLWWPILKHNHPWACGTVCPQSDRANIAMAGLKHKGVVPVVDLACIYALTGTLRVVNTRARLDAAIAAGIISEAGGADLMDAYDHIATTRLLHQAQQIRDGKAVSNYLDPSDLSDFERSHLRDAFVVVKTMQAAAGSGKGAIG